MRHNNGCMDAWMMTKHARTRTSSSHHRTVTTALSHRRHHRSNTVGSRRGFAACLNRRVVHVTLESIVAATAVTEAACVRPTRPHLLEYIDCSYYAHVAAALFLSHLTTTLEICCVRCAKCCVSPTVTCGAYTTLHACLCVWNAVHVNLTVRFDSVRVCQNRTVQTGVISEQLNLATVRKNPEIFPWFNQTMRTVP